MKIAHPNRYLRQSIVLCGIVLFIGGAQAAWGQRDFVVPATAVDADSEDPEEDAGNATLKTDPDLEAKLEKAERYRADGNYRVAAKYWQVVLQESGDTVFSADNQTYYSLVLQVEKTLASLPSDGLQAYRVTADAEAKELLSQSGAKTSERIRALSAVLQQYFISSVGDDAAFELGSIYLDRFDFTGALRLFQKIAQIYPDPSVPMDLVHLKTALCHAYLGDEESAQAAIAQAAVFAGKNGAAVANLEIVKKSIGRLSADGPQAVAEKVWKTSLGNAERNGVMPAVPAAMMQQDLVAGWQFYFEPQTKKYDRNAYVGRVRSGIESYGEINKKTIGKNEKKLINRWQDHTWRPNGQILFDENQIFFRSGADMTAWNRSAIEMSPGAEIDAAISWRSLWRNAYFIDEMTRVKEKKREWGNGRRGRRQASENTMPTTYAEIQLFGDQIGSQISIHQDQLYAIEGPRFDYQNRKSPGKLNVQWNTVARRTRTNFLTAYDRNSGQVLWSLPKQKSNRPSSKSKRRIASKSRGKDANQMAKKEKATVAAPATARLQESKDFISAGGFMAAPIGYGNMIIVPVNSGGSISVYALDPNNNGKTIWKSFLCDEPETTANPWSPIKMSVSGSDLLVNCGMGVVFSLDPASGLIRFAKRYQRSGVVDRGMNTNRHWGGPTTQVERFDHWGSDLVVPYKNQMICFSSDSKLISAYNRYSGELIWDSEIDPDDISSKIDYVIGVYDGLLYTGGYDSLFAIDLEGQGTLAWGGSRLFDGKKSRGRAMLTTNGIYVPVEDAIYHYALRDDTRGDGTRGQVLNKVQVNLGTDAPLGNLYSDGQRIWVHGGNRVYALMPQSDDD